VLDDKALATLIVRLADEDPMIVATRGRGWSGPEPTQCRE